MLHDSADAHSRICPGKELADISLYIAIAMSVAVFDITKSKDELGNEIEPLHEYVPGLIAYVLLSPNAGTPH